MPAIVCLGESPLNLAGSGPIIFTSCGTSRPPKQGRSSTVHQMKKVFIRCPAKIVQYEYSTVQYINGPIGPVHALILASEPGFKLELSYLPSYFMTINPCCGSKLFLYESRSDISRSPNQDPIKYCFKVFQ